MLVVIAHAPAEVIPHYLQWSKLIRCMLAGGSTIHRYYIFYRSVHRLSQLGAATMSHAPPLFAICEDDFNEEKKKKKKMMMKN